MKHPDLTLISHHLCPYVQRAAIALEEHGIAFERRDIDLADKPDWFVQLSPLGKVPLLVVDDDTVLFESSVIAEYVNEIAGGGLLASDILEKSSQRAWIEFASSLISTIGQLYSAPDEAKFAVVRQELANKWQILEANLSAEQWFSGADFSLVDAAVAPAFRYFDVIEALTEIDFFAAFPKLRRWRLNLAARPSVQNAVGTDYSRRLTEFIAKRDSVMGKLARFALAHPALGAVA